ncbi:hypothetical protein OEA41_005548 [Lepraria neglecta]|uniref:Uncharacterized protein n=1 Tax=Lepraria neglecta TaxID=209136 RepID=A0AAD9ZHE9_9LECA|nr:hypothetical protein OEA41_005548 [Lepraria neglecta]
MVDYDKVKQYENNLQSQSLLKDNRGEEDRECSDDDSTVIGGSEPKKDYLHCDQRFFGRRIVISLIIFLGILLTSTIVLLVWLVSLQKSLHNYHAEHIDDKGGTSHFQPSTGVRSCGSTASEAIAAGCHFDTFSFGWTPPECTDLQLYNESVSSLWSQTGDSPAFYTPNHDPIPFSALEDYATGMSPPGAAVTDRHEIFTTWEHHLVACAYGWQKVQRAAMRSWPLEEWSASYGLAKRCGPDLLTRERRDSESIKSHLKPWYPICGLEAEQMRREVEVALRD